MPESLDSLGKDEKWLHSILQKFGLKHVNEVSIAQIDQLDNIFIDKRNDNQSL
ncbi:YetF domain-containing protein [Alkalihalobacillus sp. BA299]|uniref:YetF domain-containing protein n=1 Tax=Alkalihalobacillus sp. BA299 TaxID=2815938 RepID=UPI001ADCA615|nr:YetF domain-containing protein [Alkalihalobacillus sp. BA299]